MAHRRILLDDIGPVTLYKRRGAKNVKLTVGHNGDIRVTLPIWAPYRLGSRFVEQRRSWLLTRRVQIVPLTEGLRVGKAHQLRLVAHTGTTVRTRVANNLITVTIPQKHPVDSPEVQLAIKQSAVRALKKEARQLLPQRLDALASQHGFTYRSVQIKEMRSRWGSCSQHKDIVLNCYLMQLPWELINYVLLHELLHTRVLAHGPPFWNELSRYVNDLPDIRKTMRAMQPTLHRPPLS